MPHQVRSKHQSPFTEGGNHISQKKGVKIIKDTGRNKGMGSEKGTIQHIKTNGFISQCMKSSKKRMKEMEKAGNGFRKKNSRSFDEKK